MPEIKPPSQTFMKIASEAKSDPRQTEDLIAQSIATDMDDESDEFWDAIRILQYRIEAILPCLQKMARSADVKSQEVAAIILGQNLIHEKVMIGECAEALASMLQAKPDLNLSVLESIIFSLGHLEDPTSTDLILPYRGHPDHNIRYAVAHSLRAWKGTPSVQALIALSRDSDFDVRNWATFGLRCSIDANVDTEEIRQALLVRLSDTEEEVRGEAFIGLVERRDIRVIEPLRAELAKEKRLPEILECVDILKENKEKYGASWQPVFEDIKASNPINLVNPV